MAYKRHKMYQKKMLNITHHQGNANQNHGDGSSQLLEWLLSRQELTSVGEDVKKENPCALLVGK